jgi:MFS family permease
MAPSTAGIFTVCTLIGLFNYVDRGIIPGSTNEFNSFIIASTGTSTPDVLLGMLQSSFVIGFLVGSLLFSHLIHHYERFFLTGIGCFVWLIAAVMSGVAFYTGSYVFLLFCRIFSGFGEASLQCTIPPWIQTNAGNDKKGIWLAIFYTTVPVGGALGYAYSAIISGEVGWQWAFFGEAMAAVPLVIALFWISHSAPDNSNIYHPEIERRRTRSSSLEIVISSMTTPSAKMQNSFPPSDEQSVASHTNNNNKDTSELNNNNKNNNDIANRITRSRSRSASNPSMWKEFKEVCSRPIYLCFIFGLAAEMATLVGISTFGSAIVMGLGFFDVEAHASATFGMLVCLAGILGTPLGGLMIDGIMKYRLGHQLPASSLDMSLHSIENEEEEEKETSPAPLNERALMELIGEMTYWTNFFATLIFCCLFFVEDKFSFMALITLGCFFVFMSYTGVNMATMLSVPLKHRSFALALGSLVGHLFGDVPSPILTGYLKDSLAPGCVAGHENEQNIAASDSCRADGDGLRMTVFVVSVWMYWCVILFGVAWHLIKST